MVRLVRTISRYDFVDRVRKTRVGTAIAEIETALRRSALVVLFIKGKTNSKGVGREAESEELGRSHCLAASHLIQKFLFA